MAAHQRHVSARYACVVVSLSLTLLSILLISAKATAAIPDAPAHHLINARIFEEPLIATRDSSPAEDEALQVAIAAYEKRHMPDDFTELELYVSHNPESPWRVALLTDLGLAYYHYGYFSKAISSWEQAWKEGRGVTSVRAKALVDRAVGELARMHARLGHADRIATLLDEIGDRPISGAATEAIVGAKEGLWTMQHNPGVAFLCGPIALRNLLTLLKVSSERLRPIEQYQSGPNGVTLAEVARLAKQAQIPFHLAYREQDQQIPVPAIVHWKVNHFAVIVGQTNDRLHIKDPTFGTDLWITRRALDSETSGYYLVPSSKLELGLREVSMEEANKVHGMGFTGASDNNATTPGDVPMNDQGPSCGMCVYNVTEMAVSINLKDTPVGYAPPKGPPVYVTITYNQREAGQPASFTFFNVSPKWTMNWLSYIQDDPTLPGATVTRYVAGGGYVSYLEYDTTTGLFWPEWQTNEHAILKRASDSPVTYYRYLRDGSVETYSQSDGAVIFPRRIFLTQISDPAGNSVTLNYDSQLRLTSVTDATGRNTTFAYELATNPLLVTKVTDPFGRSAHLSYDAADRLSQITDVLGLTSSFTYDASSLVSSMTTPYGITSFAYGDGVSSGPMRFAEITDPLGYHERLEFLQGAPGIPSEDSPVPVGITPFNFQGSMFMQGRDTYYWDKHVLPLYRGDYTKARQRHWLHDTTQPDVTSNVIESVKYPLERRIWRNYPGQYCAGCTGALNEPSIVARVLDDGSTQSIQNTYNWRGNLTSVTDPLGRLTVYDYASPPVALFYDPAFFTSLPLPLSSAVDPTNGVDLLDIKQQTSPGTFATIATLTYNSQHRPLTNTDAAGQTTRYAYNSAGQLTQVTDPLNETTTYVYDGLGYLLRVINANNQTQASFTYDNYSRVASVTDSEGYSVAFAYDVFDRVVKETFPDGTSREYTWDKLDLASTTDRQGRTTVYTHDANRRLVDVADPLGKHTAFAYYENGVLKSITDSNGNTTTWNIDIENRITAKQYADGRQWINTYENTSSRLKSITDPLGQTRQYMYAADDLLTGINYFSAVNPTPAVGFSYDPYFRRLTSMSDASGKTLYQYGSTGALGALKLLKELGPYQNTAIAYQYDSLGRIVGRTVDAASESVAYDNIGRIIAHSSPLGTFSLSYLGQTDQPTSRTLGNGPVKTNWKYDTNLNDRRLRQIDNGAQPRNYQITTTPEDFVAKLDVTGGGTPQSWSFSYDADNRLLLASSTTAGRYAYAYDSVDNVTTFETPAENADATYNNVNQVESFAGNSFSYDADGNLVNDGVRTYRWDAENRLVSVAFINEPNQQTHFQYNGFGRRVAIVTAGDREPDDVQETHYLWCGDVLCQARNSRNIVTRRYYPEGELSSYGPLYYAQDQLGSVRDLLGGQTGHTVASFDYDPYGKITRVRGLALSDFRYAGLFYERNSGLYLAEHRAYDAATGRWISRDPLTEFGSGTNLYAYSNGDPINAFDPSGLWNITLSGGGGGVAQVGGTNIGGGAAAGTGVSYNPGQGFQGFTYTGAGSGPQSGFGGLYIGAGAQLSVIGGPPSNVGGVFVTDTLAAGIDFSLYYNSSGQLVGVGIGVGPSIGFSRTTTNTTLYCGGQ
jgi:RHS repeat-associated protein